MKATLSDISSAPNRVYTYTPTQLAVAALVQLYYPQELWRTKYAKCRFNLMDFATERPMPSEIQTALSTMLGAATTAHLHVSMSEATKPTHQITICKEELTGLWKMWHPRVRAVSKHLGFGAIIAWREFTPIPDIAIEFVPYFTPVTRGKTAHENYIKQVTGDDFISRNELSQSSIVMRLFGTATNNRLGVFFRNKSSYTRIGFKFDHTSGDGFTRPYEFSWIRNQSMKTFPVKRNVSLIATKEPIDINLPGRNFSVMPTTDKLDPATNLSEELTFVLDQMLNTRIFPYVGVTFDDKFVDLYTMFYYRDTQTPELTLIGENRRIGACRNIPVIKYISDGLWLPNGIALDIVKGFLLCDEPYYNNAAHALMRYFGAKSLNTYNDIFGRVGAEFTDVQMELLRQKTGISTSVNPSNDGV